MSSDMLAVASTEIKMAITKKKFVSGTYKWMSNLLQIIKWIEMLSLVYLNMNEFSVIFGREFQLLL